MFLRKDLRFVFELRQDLDLADMRVPDVAMCMIRNLSSRERIVLNIQDNYVQQVRYSFMTYSALLRIYRAVYGTPISSLVLKSCQALPLRNIDATREQEQRREPPTC